MRHGSGRHAESRQHHTLEHQPHDDDSGKLDDVFHKSHAPDNRVHLTDARPRDSSHARSWSPAIAARGRAPCLSHPSGACSRSPHGCGAADSPFHSAVPGPQSDEARPGAESDDPEIGGISRRTSLDGDATDGPAADSHTRAAIPRAGAAGQDGGRHPSRRWSSASRTMRRRSCVAYGLNRNNRVRSLMASRSTTSSV